MDDPYRSPDAPLYPPDESGHSGASGNERPVAATVFGILSIIYGGLGVVCNPINGMVSYFWTPPGPPPANSIVARTLDPQYRMGVVIFAALSTVACSMLLASGIGLLAKKSWGRVLSIVAVGWELLQVAAYLAFNLIFLVAPMFKEAGLANDPRKQGEAVGGAIGATLVIVMGAVYPVLLLIFMFRPAIVRFYAPAPPEDPWADWSPGQAGPR